VNQSAFSPQLPVKRAILDHLVDMIDASQYAVLSSRITSLPHNRRRRAGW
jgi:hypothetical protein